MKKYLIIMLVAMAAALSVLWNIYSGERAERKRFESNQDALLTENREYKIRDSLNVVSTEQLVFTNRELEKYKGETARLIEDLNIKLKRVQSITTAGTETVYEIKTEVRDSVIYRDVPVPVQAIEFKNNYLELSGIIEDKKFVGKVVSIDTLVQVIHRIPRKIWFIRYGTKAIRQEIISKNPHSRISYAEYIELK